MTCKQQWDDLVNNLGRLEAMNAGLDGVSTTVSRLQRALTNVEKTVGDVSDLRGATIAGTLNMIVAMIEDLQKRVLSREE